MTNQLVKSTSHVTRMNDTYLGSRGPRGGRVLCKVKTYFKDTYDHTVAHSLR